MILRKGPDDSGEYPPSRRERRKLPPDPWLRRRKSPIGPLLVLILLSVLLLLFMGWISLPCAFGGGDSRWYRAQTELHETRKALEMYRADHGEYPESLDQLAPDYFKKLPLDPFTKQPYHYCRTNDGFEIYTLGRDHAPGGDEPPNRDIVIIEDGERPQPK